MSTFWQIQIAISFDWKKINAFCLFYSIMHSLGLQDIIMDNVVSKNHFVAKCPHACTLCSHDLRKREMSLSHFLVFAYFWFLSLSDEKTINSLTSIKAFNPSKQLSP